MGTGPNAVPETRPNPDPTVFSKELVDKEISHLRQFLEARMAGSDALKEEKFRSIHQAVARVEAVANEQRGSLGIRIDALKERLDRAEGRGAGQTAIIGAIIAVATLVLGLLVYLKP